MPAKRFRPGRWSHSMLTRYLRPSSSWKSEGSKPLLLRYTGSDHSPSIDAAGHEVVVEVAQRGAGTPGLRRPAVALHVGVDEMEQPVGVREARRPDAARIGIAEHVELTRPRRAGARAAASEPDRANDGSARPGNHSKVEVAM